MSSDELKKEFADHMNKLLYHTFLAGVGLGYTADEIKEKLGVKNE